MWRLRGCLKSGNETQQQSGDAMTERNSTLQGFGAVLLWAALAALTTYAGPVPPFQLAAITFALGACVGLVYARVTKQSLGGLRAVPLGAWALGVYGLLAFHACYFFALQRAPALEASLIIYLWPLLIVLFSGLLPTRLGGTALTAKHVAGAVLGLAGTVLVLLGKGGGGGDASVMRDPTLGYVLAVAAAVIWASYSVASRLFQGVPSLAVIGSCALSAVGAAGLHLGLETTVWPVGLGSWAAVVALGLGPVGLAFYLWDTGMKHGNVQLLGTLAYATPLLSTLLMTAVGISAASNTIWIAAILITAGGILASRKRPAP
jgi:drug/metabolite transporter (DMT)-like permease